MSGVISLKPITSHQYHRSYQRKEEDDDDVANLYKAIRDNKWNTAKAFLDQDPSALRAKLTSTGGTALHVAALFGHEEMARYLYKVKPLEELIKPENEDIALQLLNFCMNAEKLDVVLDLLPRCGELFFRKDPIIDWAPVMGIADMPSAFSNGSQLVFWKRWIYNSITIKDGRVDIQQGNHIVPGFGLLHKLKSHVNNILGIKQIYELKLRCAQATEILTIVCDKVSKDSDKVIIIAEALFIAAKLGNVEFVVQLLKARPEIVFWRQESTGWNMFFFAVQNRQAEVFNLIHDLGFKGGVTSIRDAKWNTLLHVAGELAPLFQLSRISGAALQMQRELQWFKEVKSVLPPYFRKVVNECHKKPDEVFTESHKELIKEGEKWMKDTASSCSVVGALVITIMFAAAFTVPGGNNQDFGYPIFLNTNLFKVFIVSDALSLYSSSTSVLMFLGILTSRYSAEDFLESLPRKLILGLSALFLSIVTMMIAFSASIILMLRGHSWTLHLLVMSASVPIIVFVLLQFPLLVDIFMSTYGPGIFNRKVEKWPSNIVCD